MKFKYSTYLFKCKYLFLLILLKISIYEINLNNNFYKEYTKWIVMVSFHPPQLPLIKLLNSLNSWKIIIIASNKYNDNKWKLLKHYSNKIIYLSIYKQKKLDYNINKYLEVNSYSRKNIGYLYAIHHGAKEIYEIEENMNISSLNSDIIFNNTPICYGLRNDSRMINPYSYFGEEHLWPRGFIINDIGKGYNNKFYSIKSNQLRLKPLIFQGIINGNPDLDSIFFLSKIEKELKYNFNLNKYNHNPILYFPGNYVPLNSKNTRYLYPIFPFLALPTTINVKISDILRGYILQLFCWGYNGVAIYHLTSAYLNKIRTLDDDSDFLNEKNLFYKQDSFLKALNIVNCINFNDPLKIYIKLLTILVKEGFLGEKDLLMYNAYLQDLFILGYNNSFIFNNKKNYNYKDFIIVHSEFSIYLPPNPILFIKNKNNKIFKIINHYISNHKYSDILLIVNYNHKGFEKINNYIFKLYKKNFDNIVFIMPYNINESNIIISCNNSLKGYYSYICLKKIFIKYPNFKGYLFINDDVFMKVWELENLDFNIPWIYNIHFIGPGWYHYKNCKRMFNILNNNLEWKMNLTKYLGVFNIPCAISDFYYLPNYIVPNYCKIIEEMYNSKLFLECAVPTSFGIILAPKYQIIYFQGLWGETRKKAINYLIKDIKQITIHPIKLSNVFLLNNVSLFIYFANAKDY